MEPFIITFSQWSYFQFVDVQSLIAYICVIFESTEIFNRLLGYVFSMRSLGPVLRGWAGPFPMFFLFTTESFEV